MPDLIYKEEERKLKAFDRDLKWFQDNYDSLKEKYRGEYLAVKNKKVIDHDEDLVHLLNKVEEEGIDLKSLVVELISDKKFEYVL